MKGAQVREQAARAGVKSREQEQEQECEEQEQREQAVREQAVRAGSSGSRSKEQGAQA